MDHLLGLTIPALSKSLLIFGAHHTFSYITHRLSQARGHSTSISEIPQENPLSLDFSTHQDIKTFFPASLVYNYFAFLLALMVLDLTLEIISRFTKKPKEDQLPQRHDLKDTNLASSHWKPRLFKAIMIYTMIYCFYQTTMVMKTRSNNVLTILAPQEEQPSLLVSKGGFRLLEEEREIAQDTSSISVNDERISFSLGKVVSSLNLRANKIIVTKDLEYAFIAEGSSSTVRVIDISNLAAPNVVKTILLDSSTNLLRHVSLYLSPDENTVFVSCLDILSIIDVTHPESAYLMSTVFDSNFEKRSSYFMHERFSLSFALSSDSKTLFVSGMGLQIFDISDLAKPILLSSECWAPSHSKSLDPDGDLPLSNIVQTSDGKTLWMANGTLDSYDISFDARNPKFIKSFSNEANNIRMGSIILSRDKKTAFVLGCNMTTQEIQLTKFNISNPRSPVLIKSFTFYQKSVNPAFIVCLSPNERYVFISANPGTYDLKLMVFDLIEGKVLENDQSLIKGMNTVTIIPGGNFMLASNSEKLEIIQFFKSFPNQETYSLTGYAVETMNLENRYNLIEYSQDGKYLFVVGSDDDSLNSSLHIFEVLDKISQRRIVSFGIDDVFEDFRLSEDMKRVFLRSRDHIWIVDVSDLTTPTLYSEYKIDGYLDLEDFVFWPESEIGFVVINMFSYSKKMEVRMIDFSNPASPQILEKLSLGAISDQGSKLVLSRAKKVLFVVGPTLSIYDISNASLSVVLSSIKVCTEKSENLQFAHISSDEKSLLIQTMDLTGFHKLKIYDVSNLKNPKLASELVLPLLKMGLTIGSPQVTQDSKILYFFQNEDLLAIDLLDMKAPRVSGILPFNKKDVKEMRLSPDGKTMYLIANEYQIYSMSLQNPQTLYLNQEEFYIGREYADTVLMLKSDQDSNYRIMKDSEYRFLKMGLSEIKINPTEKFAKPGLFLLPSWAGFDPTNQVLMIEPKKQLDLGYYTLYAAITNKVPKDAFNFLDSDDSTVQSKDLLATLMNIGYLNTQFFLTSDFGKLEDFYLPGKFEAFTEEIYNTLAQYYVVTCTTIKILPSLKLEQQWNGLSIISPSLNSVRMNVQLPKNLGLNAHAKFVNRHYGLLSPIITDSKSHLSIEGSLREVNSALKNITVDFSNIGTCGAEIVVMDGMNPSVTVRLNDITEYFQINSPPIVNPLKSVQKQIDDVPIYTGQYFSITFDSDTFKDRNTEMPLEYRLILNTAEYNETIPSWITLSGLTLRGIAPEELFDRTIGFALIARSEFKNITVPFKIHLKISSGHMAKLIINAVPYIVTIIGLFITANRIYNIVCKRRYRHKKNCFVEIGQEITNETIFPIMFIEEEKIESGVILDFMMKSCGGSFVDQFILEDGTVDKEKTLEFIRETVKEKMSLEKKNQLVVYLRGVDSQKQIVEQLMINRLVFGLLEKDDLIKKTFEETKYKWPEIIEWNGDSQSCRFKVNMRKLDQVLTLRDSSDDSFSENLEENLLNKKLNPLLIQALEAYTFECHCINELAIRCGVEIKEKLPGNWFKDFLKIDIEIINNDRSYKINYGINFRFDDNGWLVFHGVPWKNFKSKTLVVQIIDFQEKILKEIWIYENQSQGELKEDEKSSFGMRSEKEARGEHYEVF